MAVRYEIIKEYEDFLSLQYAWNDLSKRSQASSIFYTYEWVKAYLEKYEPEKKNNLSICVGYDQKTEYLICIFPFVLIEDHIHFITEKGTDYSNLLLDKTMNHYDIIRDGISFLIREMRIKGFILCNFPSSSELYILYEIIRAKGYLTYLRDDQTTVLYHPGDCNKKENKKQISDLKRRCNHLNIEHQVKRISAHILDEETLNFLIRVKNSVFENSPLKDPKCVEFYRYVFSNLGEKTLVNKLFIDGKLAAVHIGFEDENQVYYYLTAYDRNYAKYAIGLALLKEILDSNPSKVVDFLRGNETYKYYWGDDVHMNYILLAEKNNWKGKLITIIRKIKEGLHIVCSLNP